MDQPNLLFIVLDAVRKDHIGLYGYDRPTTPTLDAMAEELTRYNRAISAAPWTPPSHGAIFTGQYPTNSRVYGRTPNLDVDRPHIAALLSDRGYRTLGFSNSYHTSPDRGFDRGFDYYHDVLSLPRIAGHMFEPSLDFLYHVFDYFFYGYDNSAFQLRRLKTQIARTDDPFFAFINFNSAHSPYDPPEPFKSEFEEFGPDRKHVDENKARTISEDAYKFMLEEVEISQSEWDLLQCWYDGEIRYLDSLLESLFNFLEQEGIYDETAVVVTSDHGEQFGEDRLVYHQFSLAERLINVPLLIKWPEVNGLALRSTTDLVSLVDLAPTFIDLAGGTIPQEMDGQSLLRGQSHDAVFVEYTGPSQGTRKRFRKHDQLPTGLEGLQAVRTKEHKLVRSPDGEETLYEVDDMTERPIEDEKLCRDLGALLDHSLNPLPTAEIDENLPDHVADHLEKMGYK